MSDLNEIVNTNLAKVDLTEEQKTALADYLAAHVELSNADWAKHTAYDRLTRARSECDRLGIPERVRIKTATVQAKRLGLEMSR